MSLGTTTIKKTKPLGWFFNFNAILSFINVNLIMPIFQSMPKPTAQKIATRQKFLMAKGRANRFYIGSSSTRITTPLPEGANAKFHIESGYSYCASKKRGGEIDTGEDAFFISENIFNEDKNQCITAFGVSDGVGGWARMGVDPSAFSRSLMKAAEQVVETQDTLDPKQVIHESYQKVVEEGTVKAGSATVCLSIFDQNSGKLNVANLGDSGFLLFRPNEEGKYELRQSSQEQTHFFNCPFQIAIVPANTNSYSDKPDSALPYNDTLQEGDVIVTATDGLLDNIFPEEIQASLDPTQTCTEIATTLVSRAKEVATNAGNVHHDTPFAVAAAKSGHSWRGGKDDDIVCIVVRVKTTSETVFEAC